MRQEETIDVRQNIEKVRIFCTDCCAAAKILWRGDSASRAGLIHVECHGEHRLATLPHWLSRTASRPHVDLFWSDLDFMSSGELDRVEAEAETQMLKLGAVVEIIRRVRRSG